MSFVSLANKIKNKKIRDSGMEVVHMTVDTDNILVVNHKPHQIKSYKGLINFNHIN